MIKVPLTKHPVAARPEKRRRLEPTTPDALVCVVDKTTIISDTLVKIQEKLDDVSLQHRELLRYLKVHRSAMLAAVELATYKCCKTPTDTHAHVKTLSDMISAKMPVTDMYIDMCAINALAAPLNEYVRIEASGMPVHHLRLFMKSERAKQHTFMFVESASVTFSVFCDKLDGFVGGDKKVKRPKTKKEINSYLSVFNEHGIRATFCPNKKIETLCGLHCK